MIEVIKQQFNEDMSVNDKINLTREFLQILCLKIMSDKNMFQSLSFFGGTSLRIIYDLRRFSEDLDFSLIKQGSFDINIIHDQCFKAFKLYGFNFVAKVKIDGAVQGMMMKFPELLKSLGLSNSPSQNLSIKWEVDTNPPKGWQSVNTLINRHFMFNISHYDLSSLFAGKLHACFHRAYTKGRDWYDFMWYVSKKIRPNYEMLNNAIDQTQNGKSDLNESNLKEYLLDHIDSIDFDAAKKDVERFLEDKTELSIFDKDVIRGAINANL